MWEYETVAWPWKGLPANQTELNRRAEHGWELVGIYFGLMLSPDQALAVFKRRKQ